MKVVEIFGSIEGEGKRTGQLATFIRLAGCNLRCVYCDTTYSFDTSKSLDLSIDEILNECKNIGYHNVTLTGGEPLASHGVVDLITRLCDEGYQVNIETNGSIFLEVLCTMRAQYDMDFFFTVDYKTKYSGMNSKMNAECFKGLCTDLDIVKCVVANKEDMDDALKYLDSFNRKFNIWFSPVFDAISPRDIVEYVKAHNRQDVTVQVQLHKIIWDPNKKGV